MRARDPDLHPGLRAIRELESRRRRTICGERFAKLAHKDAAALEQTGFAAILTSFSSLADD